ncbi:hypothetical protein COU75_03545 [Candidatus Peregrinibacteria bacterium CG10_big_fil_rev_8_21_14_0_10_42_8]|nr:MAG: hypothetical protein COU75_03545 [Candidatus Peregrinibacteria bacterium CG10_big_fil_rev_8_21_14_0_10_42_8]
MKNDSVFSQTVHTEHDLYVTAKTSNAIAIIHGNNHRYLSDTLNSVSTQSLPFKKIFVLYRAKDEYIATCMSEFPTVVFQTTYPTHSSAYVCILPNGHRLPTDSLRQATELLEQVSDIQHITIPNEFVPTPVPSSSSIDEDIEESVPILCRSHCLKQRSIEKDFLVNMLVVIIANSHRYIAQCIDSVFLQTIKPTYILVLSEKKRALPLIRYHSDISVKIQYDTEDNFGKHIHECINAMEPQYVSMLYEDDFLDDFFFQRSMTAFKNNTYISGTIAHTEYFGNDTSGIAKHTSNLYGTVIQTELLPNMRSIKTWGPILHIPEFPENTLYTVKLHNYRRR